MSTLNYHHLRYFWAIAHEGSLTRAAERLNLSQSALSVQLGKLELQLGHPLFDRAGKRLVLTEAGRIALDYADTVFQAGDELVSTMKGRPVDRRQAFRVGALTTLSRNFQLEFLSPLTGRDDVELIIRSGNMRDLLAQLEAHTVDVVLANSAPQLDARSDLRSHLLAQQPVAIVRRPSAEAFAFRFPEDLQNQPILLPSLDSEIRVGFDRIVELAGVRPLIIAEVDDMAMLRLLARDGEGLALVPPIVVRDELAAGVLVEVCPVPSLSETFYAITQKRRFPNPLLADLLACAAKDK
jgi:LysR family transcriptional activator of nhaA